MGGPETIFAIIILIFSVIVHELAHGYSALFLGDPTAKYAGRLTLNPVPHLDPMGSLFLPGILILLNSPFVLGWAKPVPINPYNLRHPKGEAIIAAAGPLSNIAIAVIFGLLIRAATAGLIVLPEAVISLSAIAVLINLVLAVFNLMPVPPLDGSKILFNFLPTRYMYIRDMFEQYGIVILILFILVIWQVLFPVILFLFQVITGAALPMV